MYFHFGRTMMVHKKWQEDKLWTKSDEAYEAKWPGYKKSEWK